MLVIAYETLYHICYAKCLLFAAKHVSILMITYYHFTLSYPTTKKSLNMTLSKLGIQM